MNQADDMIQVMPSRDNRIENHRRAKREARNALAEPLYEPPAAADCDVEPLEIDLPVPGHRIDIVLYYVEKRLVRFFIAWKCLDRHGDWTEKYSVCTLHGYLHEHTTGHHRPDDRRDIRPLRSQVDVQECHDRAYDRVHDKFVDATGGAS